MFNESFNQSKAAQSAILKKWDKALNAWGGIKDEHMAITTAIVMENYLNYLNENPKLIAEDKINAGSNFMKGVNLALLGLIRRAVPELVGAELVGVQAMPTPKSPIFTLLWKYSNNKGGTTAGDEFWPTPYKAAQNAGGQDPYYSSSQVRYESSSATSASTSVAANLSWANKATGVDLNHEENANPDDATVPYILPGSLIIEALDGSGSTASVIAQATMTNAAATFGADFSGAALTGYAFDPSATGVFASAALNYVHGSGSARTITVTGVTSGIAAAFRVSYEVSGEAETKIPEIHFTIKEQVLSLVRRQLRGRFTLDAAYDLKALHGISLESELMETMKLEMMNGINREILDDLRMMAGTVQTLKFSTASGIFGTNSTYYGVSPRYDDFHKVTLDAVSNLSAQIWDKGRLGYGNFVVGNPVTLAFLDRVAGFVGAGVSYDAKGLTFAGSLGGRIKFYKDPQFRKDEFLVGYKGASALDTGYIHAPYLPITAVPTLYNERTGDPLKLYYTRYAKTWTRSGGDNGGPMNAIDKGQFQYARLKLPDFPVPFN